MFLKRSLCIFRRWSGLRQHSVPLRNEISDGGVEAVGRFAAFAAFRRRGGLGEDSAARCNGIFDGGVEAVDRLFVAFAAGGGLWINGGDSETDWWIFRRRSGWEHLYEHAS